MELHLQQRIVGAIVLVTLGVIFIPALLDGSGYKSRQVQDIEIKEKPKFAPLSQKKVKPVQTPLAQNKIHQLSVQKSDPDQHHKKAIKSFALQVGTFDQNKNAIKLRDKLRKAGYTAFVFKSSANGKTSYKVRVGPELKHSVLEKTKEKIKKTMKIDGYIVNHP
jgi:DedD protein